MGHELRILIVDDSVMMRAMIKRAIALTGADVSFHEAGNGRDALEVLEHAAIDVVFTDINMPVMTGTELLREMAGRGWRHIQRVVVSTDGSDARRDEVRHLDVSLYINKPFPPEAVRDVLNQISHTAVADRS
jgi:two-component system chemotaxis response regulator CheY